MIHQYKNNGYNIVLDVNSGAVHIVDDLVYDIIPSMERLVRENKWLKNPLIEDENLMEEVNYLPYANKVFELMDTSFSIKHQKQELLDAICEVLLLKDAEMLFTEDIYENYITDFKKRETVVKALCLHIAHDCNLAC